RRVAGLDLDVVHPRAAFGERRPQRPGEKVPFWTRFVIRAGQLTAMRDEGRALPREIVVRLDFRGGRGARLRQERRIGFEPRIAERGRKEPGAGEYDERITGAHCPPKCDSGALLCGPMQLRSSWRAFTASANARLCCTLCRAAA